MEDKAERADLFYLTIASGHAPRRRTTFIQQRTRPLRLRVKERGITRDFRSHVSAMILISFACSAVQNLAVPARQLRRAELDHILSSTRRSSEVPRTASSRTRGQQGSQVTCQRAHEKVNLTRNPPSFRCQILDGLGIFHRRTGRQARAEKKSLFQE